LITHNSCCFCLHRIGGQGPGGSDEPSNGRLMHPALAQSRPNTSPRTAVPRRGSAPAGLTWARRDRRIDDRPIAFRSMSKFNARGPAGREDSGRKGSPIGAKARNGCSRCSRAIAFFRALAEAGVADHAARDTPSYNGRLAQSTLAALSPAHLGRAQQQGEGVRHGGYRGGVRSEARGEAYRTSRPPSAVRPSRTRCRPIPLAETQQLQRGRQDRANGCKPCMGGGSLNLHPRLRGCCQAVCGLPSVIEHFGMKPSSGTPMR